MANEDIDRHVLRKYEVIQRLGRYVVCKICHGVCYRGAYGIVWKAISRKTSEVVALKKCFDAFQNSTDAQRTFREIMYLQELHDHPNIVRIVDVLKAENNVDIYIVTDFMESDLHAVIKAGILEEVHKQYIIFQLVSTLRYMHSGDLIHRDIKPSNILLNSDSSMKLCDFGLARSVHSSAPDAPSPVMTDYVATRWYRSPEILFGSPTYTKGVDVWAVGCMLGEMMCGRPLFAGTSTLDQLERILAYTGFPNLEDIEGTCSPYAVSMLDSLQKKKSSLVFPTTCSAASIDFVNRCLQFNPKRRPSMAQLLTHPFLSSFFDPTNVPTTPVCPIRISLDDNVKLSVEDYRTRIYESIMARKKSQPRPATAEEMTKFAPYRYRSSSAAVRSSSKKPTSPTYSNQKRSQPPKSYFSWFSST